MKKKSFGKGWILILYAFLAYFTATGIGSAMNVAAGTLSNLRGWNSTFLTSLISLGSLANIVAGFLFGRLSVKHSAKPLSIICCFIYLAAVIWMSLAAQLLVFGICLVVAGGISSAMGYQLSPVLISKWFPKNKGMVMGLATMGIPLCAGVASLIYNTGYNAFGAVGGFIGFIAVAVIALLILILFLSDNPKAKGFVPDNGIVEENAAEEGTIRKDSIWTTSKLLKTPQVWVLGIALGIQMLFASGLMVQLVPRLLEIGYTINSASLLMVASGILAMLGCYFNGFIEGKIGARKGVCLTYLCGAVAMFANLTGTAVGVWVSLVFIGMVVGGGAVWPASLCVDMFKDEFASGYGVIQPIIQLVGAIGPAFFAIVAGATGGYTISYLSGAGIMIIGLLLFVLFTRPNFVEKEEAKVKQIGDQDKAG